MSETCLSAGKLASVIFGAILGTLLICAVFVVLLWQWFKKHRNDSKIFYVERAEKEPTKDVESGHQQNEDSDQKQMNGSLKTKNNEHDQVDAREQRPITQKSIVLNDKRNSINTNNQFAGETKVLPNLGVTIAKSRNGGFQVTSVEKTESRFMATDLVTELAINLDQMTLEDAAKLLELLVPYRIQLEVLRSNSELDSMPPQLNGDVLDEKTDVEIHKETEKLANESNELAKVEDQQNEEAPSLPSVSPPTSPIPNNQSTSPSNLPIPPTTSLNKRDSKSSTDEEQQPTQRSARHATRIPTPKTARNSKKSSLEMPKDQTESEIFNRIGHQKMNDFPSYSTKRDVLIVSNETVDEYGLSDEQYKILENNRQRLERERQSLKEMGILT